MLGSVKSCKSWSWGAAGKHPVARDYIGIGVQTPLLKAFSEWVEAGFSSLAGRQGQERSWRFWARGMRKQDLVCGLLRDSNDHVGRSYPLLMLGTGPLEGWEETWDLLPYVFEGLWSRMEYLSAKKAYDLAAFEGEVASLPYPALFQGAGASPDDAGGADLPVGADELFIPLSGASGDDPAEAIATLHAKMKAARKEAPGMVFMGGSPEHPYLVVLRRSLAVNDFTRLWTLA